MLTNQRLKHAQIIDTWNFQDGPKKSTINLARCARFRLEKATFCSPGPASNLDHFSSTLLAVVFKLRIGIDQKSRGKTASNKLQSACAEICEWYGISCPHDGVLKFSTPPSFSSDIHHAQGSIQDLRSWVPWTCPYFNTCWLHDWINPLKLQVLPANNFNWIIWVSHLEEELLGSKFIYDQGFSFNGEKHTISFGKIQMLS